MPHRLGDGRRVRDDAVADRVIAADQDELLKGLGRPAFFQKPKQALHRDIHDLFRRFFDMGHVHHVGHALQAGARGFALRQIAADDFDPLLRGHEPVMTQRADLELGKGGVGKETRQEGLPNFAGCAGHQNDCGVGAHGRLLSWVAALRVSVGICRCLQARKPHMRAAGNGTLPARAGSGSDAAGRTTPPAPGFPRSP